MADQPPSLPPQRPRAPMPTLLDEETTSTRLGTLRVRDKAVLTQMTGLEAGRVCEVTGAETTFGRSTECSHAFDEASLSRVHAKIVKDGGAYVIEDSGSRNGIFVNDAKVEKATTLHDGDRVRLGTAVTLRFQLVDDQEKQTLVRVFESSVKDGLTGAWNRKYLDERLRGEVAFATRHRAAFSIVMMDIDHFKKINDTYGHPAGDQVLRMTSAIMRAAIRTEDLLGRYGGEEFVVVARGDLKAAVQLAERLRVIVERRPVEADGQIIERTISAGVASLECCGGEQTVEKLVSVADDRLYRAKEAGRNRVVGSG